jgi:galactitol-specific phosphotransferase system IIC component
MDTMSIVGTVLTLTPLVLIIAVIISRGKKILD